MVIDATRSLRWYLGVAVLLVGVLPPLMVGLTAPDGEHAGRIWLLLVAVAPFNAVGLAFTVAGMARRALGSRRAGWAWASLWWPSAPRRWPADEP